MSTCCKCCKTQFATGAETDKGDPGAVAAAATLIAISGSHFESELSSSGTCGGLPAVGQLTGEADEDSQTEVEDWQAIGAETLHVRASGRYLEPDTSSEAGMKGEDRLAVFEQLPIKIEPNNDGERGSSLELKVKTRQEEEAVGTTKAGLRRSKRALFAKTQLEE